MELFSSIVRQVTKAGTVLAGACLLGAMLVVVASVTTRFFNVAITGSHELMELLISATIAIALVYTALRKGHVVVKIVLDKFSVRWKAITGIGTSLLSMGIWGTMSIAALLLVFDKGTRELSETLEIPYLPFRLIFIIGLILLSLTFVSDFIEEYRKVRSK